MEEITKQSIGIDCAKDDFVVTFSICDGQQNIKHLSSRSFNNDSKGFGLFNKWFAKFWNQSVPLILVMEATGVYHERLAYFLSDKGYRVAVVLPKRAKDFSKTLKVKSINDRIASQYLAIMGLEKKLDLWSKPSKQYHDLKRLTREKERLQQQITQTKNQLHAEKSGMYPHANTLKRLNQHLKLLEKQREQILAEIRQTVKDDSELNEKVKKLITIPGVGLLTAAVVIGETDGFSNVQNKRQLVSYAGYDVIKHESGTSVKTKGRISKRGNRHLRKAMHMPALSSIAKAGKSKELFTKIVENSGIKMKGVVAVQRKLLVLIYTLWKHNTEYQANYEIIKKGSVALPTS